MTNSTEISISIKDELIQFVHEAFDVSQEQAKDAIRRTLEYQFFVSSDYLDQKVLHQIEFFAEQIKKDVTLCKGRELQKEIYEMINDPKNIEIVIKAFARCKDTARDGRAK